ncbi:MAG TPA: ATP-binding protein, partial [Archangium sp.]
MRFQKLHVENFKAIKAADLELGPGLNVLYGPNDLGKSTLGETLRAALLLPSDSSVADGFVPWHEQVE